MAILSKGTTYAEDDQVTHTNLNALVDSATFDTPADNTTITLTGGGLLQVGEIATANIADAAVTTAKLASSAVANGNLGALSVSAAKIQTDAVTTAKIQDTAVTAAKLNTNAISGQTELSAAPADADELLISDAGVIKKIGVDNFLTHPACPQAYGRITYDTSAAALSGAYNLQNPASTSSTSRTLEFINDMANTNYIVMVTIEDTAVGSYSAPVVTSKSTGAFTITLANAENTGAALAVVVFGTRA